MELYRLWPAGLVLLMALLGSCNMGAPESMLAEHAFKEAAGALQLAIGQRTRAFRIDTDDSEFTLQMQDPASPNHIDAWSHYYQTIRNIVSWEGTRGPSAVDPTLINPKLEENLFNLADVDFAAYPKLAQAAIARAGLQDPARVLKVNIQRRIFLIPSPSNGDVRWTLQVSSGREQASIFANAKGAITGGNFDSTLRAQKLDMYKGGKPLTDAIAEIRATLGPGPKIRRFNFSDSYLWFTGASPTYPGKVGGWVWNLNGMLYSGDDPIQTPNPGMPVALFSTDDVDWSVLPKVMAAAKQALQMPNGKVGQIHITEPGNPAQAIEWEVWVEDRSDDGWVTANKAGDILKVHPPRRS
ncbi:MAG TPA: hypothetical protein VIJ52_07090 [Pseudolabrys sp.]